MIATNDALRGLQDGTALTRFHRFLPIVLSIVAGMVDTTGFLRFGIFTSHITGNIVLIAALIVRGGHVNIAQVLAVPVFIVAVAGTWLIAAASGKRGARLSGLLLLVHLLLLACVLLFSVCTDASSNPHGLAGTVAAMTAVSAMACQYALLRMTMPVAPTTAVMTGNLTTTCLHLMDPLSPSPLLMMKDPAQARGTLHLLIGFFVGCVSAAVAVTFCGDWAWSAPTVMAVLAVVLGVEKPDGH